MVDHSNDDLYKRIESLEQALYGLTLRERWWKKVACLAGVCTAICAWGARTGPAFRRPSKPRPSSYETRTERHVRSS